MSKSYKVKRAIKQDASIRGKGRRLGGVKVCPSSFPLGCAFYPSLFSFICLAYVSFTQLVQELVSWPECSVVVTDSQLDLAKSQLEPALALSAH